MIIFKKNLYLVRHGEVDFNREDRIIGSKDLPLNEFGKKQAEILADEVKKKYSIDRLISSDLKRAKQTADAIGKKLGMKAEMDGSFQERDYGVIEGKTKAELKKIYPDFVSRSGIFIAEHDFPEAEPIDDFCKRVINGIKNILQKYPDENVMIVTHAGILRAVYSYVYNVPIEKVREVYRPEHTNCMIENY